MSRPKKAPRDRLQITLPKALAKKLRAYCKRNDLDLSYAIAKAVGQCYLFDPPTEKPEKPLGPGGMFPFPRD